MIEIIERGTKTIGECENCGCKFSYENEDIETVFLGKNWVVCPQCGKEIVISTTR